MLMTPMNKMEPLHKHIIFTETVLSKYENPFIAHLLVSLAVVVELV
jgi:hypothetical protein